MPRRGTWGTVAEQLGGRVVVKAQVHAGGRGKAGGVKLADSPVAAEAAAGQILGMRLRTPQTPPEGITVLRVLVEEASPIRAELYLSMTLDRGRSAHVVMASQAGGMEIEEVAAAHPEKIIREWADPALGLQPFQARHLAFGLGLAGNEFKAGVGLIQGLFRAYLDKDCTLVKINPLVVTQDPQKSTTFIVLDAPRRPSRRCSLLHTDDHRKTASSFQAGTTSSRPASTSACAAPSSSPIG